jgi:hypothetical protein
METEEAGYRLLLKEVIESRASGGGGVDLSHLRREKKKKREAERGASKGRKIRCVTCKGELALISVTLYTKRRKISLFQSRSMADGMMSRWTSCSQVCSVVLE